MRNSDQFNIIIVGAGPAGISTALHLAQIAPEMVARTLILEKAHHPRPKLCGGGILPDAEVVLRHLGLDITEIPHYDVEWAHFDYDGKGMTMRGEKGGDFAFRTIRRHEFDAWLAAKARERGFLIHENTSVKQVTVTGSEVVLETDKGDYRASVVIGADGSKSIVRRIVVPQEKTHTARLLEIVTEPRPEQSFHIQADSYFDFLYVPQGILGYTWDFPALENGQPVRVRGIYDSNVYSVKTDVSLRDALADEFRHHGYNLDAYKLEGHPLRWFEAKSSFSIPHILLVGDAAGGDALFGEGISIALGYGGLAARVTKDAFTKENFSFREYKPIILRSELGKALRRRTWFAKFFYRLRSRRIQTFVWHKLGWLIEWVMQKFMIGWARRQERKKV
jgi:menaquinone-9 beta-reductase